MRRLRSTAVAVLAAASVGGVALAAAGGPPSGTVGPGERSGSDATIGSRAGLANRCVAIASAMDGRYVAMREGGYGVDRRARAGAASFHLKPTDLGTYLIHDPTGGLLAAGASGAVVRADAPGAAAEWAIGRAARRSFAITSTADGRRLAVAPASGELVLANAAAGPATADFAFWRKRGCTRFPEAEVGATGSSPAGTNPDGTVFGFADAHIHIAADMRAGGRVIHGKAFDRFGISEALGHDEDDHGPDGSLDVTGNLLRDGSPVGTHDTHGWPTFAGWPVHDTITHQQAYYVWLQRAWKAGLRLVVAQTVEDEPLCELEPLRSHSCDETDTIKLQIERLRALEEYVDAQSGGRGRGWFQIVTSPRQARRVIESGRLAVVIGIESSNPLGCSEFQGEPQCTREDIDRGLEEFHRLGVRSLFIAHWTDNAFAGAAFEGGARGDFIGVFQQMQTGHSFATEPCTESDESDGQCNAKGLTDLGQYVVQGLMKRRMLIEADHLSQKARKGVMALTVPKRYPVVSSHTGTGGEWTPAQLEQLYSSGGLATVRPGTAPEIIEDILRLRRLRSPKHYFGLALGSDTGGFSELPGPRADAGAKPLTYPFTSYDGEVEFGRPRSGERVYDLNGDGIAHYGLFADLIADIEQHPRGERALRSLFRSAEAYLQMWERAGGRR